MVYPNTFSTLSFLAVLTSFHEQALYTSWSYAVQFTHDFLYRWLQNVFLARLVNSGARDLAVKAWNRRCQCIVQAKVPLKFLSTQFVHGRLDACWQT